MRTLSSTAPICPRCGNAPQNDDGSYACGSPTEPCNPYWMFNTDSAKNQLAIEQESRRRRARRSV